MKRVLIGMLTPSSNTALRFRRILGVFGLPRSRSNPTHWRSLTKTPFLRPPDY
jgi:hypothetical protein